jgi:ZIP family zinc transporter
MNQAEGIQPEKRRRSTLLMLAITLHNIPEGLAIGVAFGAVAAGFPSVSLAGAITLAIGALAVIVVQPLLPYALSFAAGGMIFVVEEERIPSSHENGNRDLATIWLLVGYVIMMILDVAFG